MWAGTLATDGGAGTRGVRNTHIKSAVIPGFHFNQSTSSNSKIQLFTARCTIVQSAVLRLHVVCLSVRL